MLSLLRPGAPSAASHPPELRIGEATAMTPTTIPKSAAHAFIVGYG